MRFLSESLMRTANSWKSWQRSEIAAYVRLRGLFWTMRWHGQERRRDMLTKIECPGVTSTKAAQNDDANQLEGRHALYKRSRI